MFFMSLAKAQEPQQNENRLNPTLDKFVGTWLWTNMNGDTLKVVFTKQNFLFLPSINFRTDVLVGFHYYKVKSLVKPNSTQVSYVIEENSLPFIGRANDISSLSWTLFGGNDGATTPNQIECTIKEPSNNNHKRDIFIQINSNHTAISWVIRESSGIKVHQYREMPVLPNNIMLIKQP